MSHGLLKSKLEQRNKSRLALGALLLLFLLPVIIAYGLLQTEWYKTQGTFNRGNLVQPPLLFDELALENGDSTSFDRKQFGKQWWMVFVLPDQCEVACRNTLYQMRQVEKAMGADRHRVSRLAISHQPLDAGLSRLIADQFPKLHVARASADSLNQLFQPAQLNLMQPQESGLLYLVDPTGLVFMVYPEYADEMESVLRGKDVLKDLKHVLKVSRVG